MNIWRDPEKDYFWNKNMNQPYMRIDSRGTICVHDLLGINGDHFELSFKRYYSPYKDLENAGNYYTWEIFDQINMNYFIGDGNNVEITVVPNIGIFKKKLLIKLKLLSKLSDGTTVKSSPKKNYFCSSDRY